MNKFKYYFILLLTGISLVSCNKSDDDEVVTVPLRDYAVQYKVDNDSIEQYLKTNYIKEVTADFDVTIEKIPAGGTQVSIWNQQTYPLKSRNVYSNDITYKVYYLVFREGSGNAPTNTDKIFTSYTGTFLNGKSFDSSNGYPFEQELYIYAAKPCIEGWSEIFPQFKTGTSKTDPSTGVITYENYGAGMMFLPSGLAYYGRPQGSIPEYTCINFTFKLFDLLRLDHDIEVVNGESVNVPDGIPDYLEDLNQDGYLYNYIDKAKYPNPPAGSVDDTDGDGVPDFLDYDDDGDGFKTRFEIAKPADQIGMGTLNDAPFYFGVKLYYPWDAILVDNPLTPNVDEREPRGIPRRPTGALADPSKPESATNVKAYTEEDFTAPSRKRIHLDSTYPIKKN